MNVAFKFRCRHLTKSSLDKLFRILTPFLEKDIFCLFVILDYSRKKLPLKLVDHLTLYE